MADEVKGGGKQPSHQLREDVASRLANTGSKVRSMVVDNLAEKEINDRMQAVLSLIDRIGEKEKELRRAESEGKPAGFNLQGDVVGDPIYTKQQLEEIKKLRETTEKMQQALTKAFEQNDFSKVKEMAKGNQGGGAEKQKDPQ